MARLFLFFLLVPVLAHASFFMDGDTPQNAPPAPQTQNTFLQITAVEKWTITKGEKLSDVFARWSSESKRWKLIWDAPDRVIENDISLECSFEDAVSQVIQVLNDDGEYLIARFYEKNSVLRIQEAE